MKSSLTTVLIGFTLFLAACGGSDPVAVVSITPEADATGVEPTTSVVLSLNGAIDPLLAVEPNLTVTGSTGYTVAGTWVFDDLNFVLTFTPAPALPLNDTVTVTATVDMGLGAEYTSSFSVRDGVWGAAMQMKTSTDTINTGLFGEVEVLVTPGGNALLAWRSTTLAPATNFWGMRFDNATNLWSAEEQLTVTNGASGSTATNGAGGRIGYLDTGDYHLAWDNGSTSLNTRRYNVSTTAWDVPDVLEALLTGGNSNPTIASNGSGSAAMIYSNSTAPVKIYARHYDPATGIWSVAAPISTNITDAIFPKLEMMANGNLIAVWYQNLTKDIMAARFDAATASWGAPVLVHTDATLTLGDKHLAIDPNGNAFLTFVMSGSILVARFDATAGTWDTPGFLETQAGPAYVPEVAVDAAGNAIAVWNQFNGTVHDIWAAHFDVTTGLWSQKFLGNSNYSEGNVSLVMDKAGNAVVGFSQLIGAIENAVAIRYSKVSNSWSAPVLLEYDDRGTIGFWSITTGMDSAGRATMGWAQFDGTNTYVYTNQFR